MTINYRQLTAKGAKTAKLSLIMFRFVANDYSNILSILKNMGFEVLPIFQAPFNAVSQSSSRNETTILTGVGWMHKNYGEKGASDEQHIRGCPHAIDVDSAWRKQGEEY